MDRSAISPFQGLPTSGVLQRWVKTYRFSISPRWGSSVQLGSAQFPNWPLLAEIIDQATSHCEHSAFLHQALKGRNSTAMGLAPSLVPIPREQSPERAK
jgi:hypothetical protein